MSSRDILANAIVALAGDSDLLARFKADPIAAGAELGLTPEWSEVIAQGDRDRLRAAGLNDAMTIMVSRWLKDDVGDSTSAGLFVVDRTSPLPPANVPAGLVFAAGCSHVPDLLARPEIDPPEAVERLLSGYAKIAKALAEANPDVIIVTTDAHFQGFENGGIVVGTAAEHSGDLAFFRRPDIDLAITGDPDFAQAIADAVRTRGLDVEECTKIDLDHGLIVPLRLVLPRPDLPVVPIVTQPSRTFSPFNARRFGEVLRDVIALQGKRVALLATGGLSHWLDPGKFGKVDVEFDSYILEMMKAGRGYDIGNLEPYPLLDHGQYEFMNWLIMLGAVGQGVRAEVLAYEPMEGSGGGWAVTNMLLPAKAEAYAHA